MQRNPEIDRFTNFPENAKCDNDSRLCRMERKWYWMKTLLTDSVLASVLQLDDFWWERHREMIRSRGGEEEDEGVQQKSRNDF
uniref:Uncharacterized protein n=1 Tax=Ascaris lumbricoides TaxID=6252 RepID=A0A0M3IV54_ASCLU